MEDKLTIGLEVKFLLNEVLYQSLEDALYSTRKNQMQYEYTTILVGSYE